MFLADSAFPAASVERNSTWWDPSPVTGTGPEYVCQAAPSTRDRIPATPARSSTAERVTLTEDRYQPSAPTVPDGEAVVVGGVPSMTIVAVSLSVLPVESRTSSRTV